jgi:hypothetical protein
MYLFDNHIYGYIVYNNKCIKYVHYRIKYLHLVNFIFKKLYGNW